MTRTANCSTLPFPAFEHALNDIISIQPAYLYDYKKPRHFAHLDVPSIVLFRFPFSDGPHQTLGEKGGVGHVGPFQPSTSRDYVVVKV